LTNREKTSEKKVKKNWSSKKKEGYETVERKKRGPIRGGVHRGQTKVGWERKRESDHSPRQKARGA